MRKNFRKIILAVLFLALAATIVYIFFSVKGDGLLPTVSKQATQTPVKSLVLASGLIISSNQQSLHFLAAGEVVQLPFKEGDQIKKGEIIAAEDQTTAEKNLTIAEANYRSDQSALNLVIDNIHLFQYGNGGFSNIGSANETQTQKTQRQEAEEAVNAAYDNVQIAKVALSNTVLKAPFDGTLIHEDIKSTGVNALVTDSFVLADLNHLVFEVKVPAIESNNIALGESVQVVFDQPESTPISATVSKIYPGEVTLDDGGVGFKVDVVSPDFNSSTPLGQTGTLILPQNLAPNILSVPSWTILGHHFIWVLDEGKLSLKRVQVGQSYKGMTQVLSGLTSSDQVILDPKKIIQAGYLIY